MDQSQGYEKMANVKKKGSNNNKINESNLTAETTSNREGKPSIWAGFYKKTINERQDQVFIFIIINLKLFFEAYISRSSF